MTQFGHVECKVALVVAVMPMVAMGSGRSLHSY